MAVGLNLINNSPIISGNTISADIRITGTPQAVFCALTGLPRQDCECENVQVPYVDLLMTSYTPQVKRFIGKVTPQVKRFIGKVTRL